jgi:hypothetical protein
MSIMSCGFLNRAANISRTVIFFLTAFGASAASMAS